MKFIRGSINIIDDNDDAKHEEQYPHSVWLGFCEDSYLVGSKYNLSDKLSTIDLVELIEGLLIYEERCDINITLYDCDSSKLFNFFRIAMLIDNGPVGQRGILKIFLYKS